MQSGAVKWKKRGKDESESERQRGFLTPAERKLIVGPGHMIHGLFNLACKSVSSVSVSKHCIQRTKHDDKLDLLDLRQPRV